MTADGEYSRRVLATLSGLVLGCETSQVLAGGRTAELSLIGHGRRQVQLYDLTWLADLGLEVVQRPDLG